MRNLILVAILATVFVAACGDEPTGPTTDSGEVNLYLFKHRTDASKSTGEGFNFATAAKVKITNEDARHQIGEISDIDAFPEPLGGFTDYAFWAVPNRIHRSSSQYSYLHLNYKETAEFELVTLDGKRRYKINAKYIEKYRDAHRDGDVSVFYFRYELLSS